MKPILVLLLVGNVCLCSFASFSQTPTLEFTAGAGNPTTLGPVSSQSITFQNNTDNPTGNTFAAFSTPTTTATFSPGNFQYNLGTWLPSYPNPLMIGASNNSGINPSAANVFALMNSVGAAADADFTSASTVTPGTGITQAVNEALWMIGVSLPTSQVVALALPITNFIAISQGATAQLQWNTETEENSRFFDIEANRSGKGWQSVGIVMAAGNSSISRRYSFTDVNAVAGNNAYRIKEVDADGSAIYSSVVNLSFGGNSQTRFFPNPVKDRLYIMGNGDIIGSVVVSDTEGKEVYQTGALASGNSLDMSHLPGGVYFVTIHYVSGQVETAKVIKN